MRKVLRLEPHLENNKELELDRDNDKLAMSRLERIAYQMWPGISNRRPCIIDNTIYRDISRVATVISIPLPLVMIRL